MDLSTKQLCYRIREIKDLSELARIVATLTEFVIPLRGTPPFQAQLTLLKEEQEDKNQLLAECLRILAADVKTLKQQRAPSRQPTPHPEPTPTIHLTAQAQEALDALPWIDGSAQFKIPGCQYLRAANARPLIQQLVAGLQTASECQALLGN